jgi:hypothetical protein
MHQKVSKKTNKSLTKSQAKVSQINSHVTPCHSQNYIYIIFKKKKLFTTNTNNPVLGPCRSITSLGRSLSVVLHGGGMVCCSVFMGVVCCAVV